MDYIWLRARRGEQTDPQSLNRYTYCRNNPHKYNDPDGKWIHIAAGALVGAGWNMFMYYSTHNQDDFKASEFFATGIAGAVTGGIGAATGSYIANLGLSVVESVGIKLGINIISEGIGVTIEYLGAHYSSDGLESNIAGDYLTTMLFSSASEITVASLGMLIGDSEGRLLSDSALLVEVWLEKGIENIYDILLALELNDVDSTD